VRIKMKLYFLAAILILLFVASIFLFTKQKQPSYPQALCKDCNVIFITMTNLRYDHMSSNGYFRPTTPNLDKLAKESLIFDNAFSHSSWTLPEAISIYTSLYPYQHGVMSRHDGSQLPKDFLTLVDILNKHEYDTVAFTGGFDYSPEYGLINRFSKYVECSEEARRVDGTLVGFRSGVGSKLYGGFSCTIAKALGWIKNSVGGKFFMHVQGYDAHCPFSHEGGDMYDPNYLGTVDFSDCLWTYDSAETTVKEGKTYYEVFSAKGTNEKKVLLSEDDIEHLVALYDESITVADREIGRFIDSLKSLGFYDKTIIVFTSEHGDMFGKKARFMRGGPRRGTFYDDVLHVPLMIKHPRIESLRVDGLAEHIDIMPTLLDFLGIYPSKSMEGKSLTPLIFKKEEIHRYVFAGSEFRPPEVNPFFVKRTRIEAIRNRQWKMIQETVLDNDLRSQILELYDIKKDSIEANNVAGVYPDVVRELQLRLAQWSKEHKEK